MAPTNENQDLSLPNEIVDYIVSYLWDDHSSLAKCSLVCRGWSSIVRPFLFHKVTLGHVETLQELDKMLDATAAMRYWIREICITDWATLHLLWMSPSPPLHLEKLEKLHSLQIATTSNSPLLPGNADVLAQNLDKLHTVQELTFTACSNHPQFVGLVSSCLPSLHSLSLAGHMITYGKPYEFTHGRHPRLSSLSIESSCSPFRSILSPESLQTVQSLQLLNIRWGIHHVKFIIDNVGLSLHNLRLNYTRDGSIGVGIPSILGSWNVQRMKGLRHVHLGTLHTDNQFISILLCKMRTLPIETIILDIFFDRIDDLEPGIHFRDLSHAFTAPALEHLKSVHVVHSGSLNPRSACDRLKQVFPSLAARGIELKLSKHK